MQCGYGLNLVYRVVRLYDKAVVEELRCILRFCLIDDQIKKTIPKNGFPTLKEQKINDCGNIQLSEKKGYDGSLNKQADGD